MGNDRILSSRSDLNWHFLNIREVYRKETVFGHVIPVDGAFRITSQISGITDQLVVREGQFVRAGQHLLSISSNPTLENGSSLSTGLKSIQSLQIQAQASQAQARMQQIHSQIDELNARRSGLLADLERLRETSTILSRRNALQLETLNANRALQLQGMVSALMVRQHEDSLLEIQGRAFEVERVKAQQQSELLQLGSRLSRLHAETKLAKSEATAIQAQMREKQLNSDVQLSRKIIAPTSGTITALQIRQGSPVNVGQTLAAIVPGVEQAKEGLEVELWAPSRAIGFVKQGTPVRIMYDAFPYQTFGVGIGSVREVSGTAVAPNELPVPIETREQLFRVRVSIPSTSLKAYQRQWNLVPGMRLSADIVLEEQTIFEWMLAPLRAIHNR